MTSSVHAGARCTGDAVAVGGHVLQPLMLSPGGAGAEDQCRIAAGQLAAKAELIRPVGHLQRLPASGRTQVPQCVYHRVPSRRASRRQLGACIGGGRFCRGFQAGSWLCRRSSAGPGPGLPRSGCSIDLRGVPSSSRRRRCPPGSFCGDQLVVASQAQEIGAPSRNAIWRTAE